MFKLLIKALLSAMMFSGCAILHHVQVGSVDASEGSDIVMVPFDIKVSEIGISTDEAGKLANQDDVAAIIAMFQMGNRTGNPVYNERYAEKLIYEIYQKCPTGNVVNLISVREMRKYPVISGEIVKITGECKILKSKGT